MGDIIEQFLDEAEDHNYDRSINSENYGIYLLVFCIIASFYLVVNHVLNDARDVRNVARKAAMKGN